LIKLSTLVDRTRVHNFLNLAVLLKREHRLDNLEEVNRASSCPSSRQEETLSIKVDNFRKKKTAKVKQTFMN
jgi:hypothetical protein